VTNMLSRKHPLAGLCLSLVLALLGILYVSAEASDVGTVSAQEQQRQQGQPPVASLEADTRLVTICPRDTAQANTQVQLRANARDPQGRSLRYTWTTTGGRIVGDGPNPVWDLSGVSPGVYTASVEVDNGLGAECRAFSSTKVAVNECPPLRELCPNISIYCPDTVTIGAPVTFTAEISGGTMGVTPVYNWKVSAGTITGGQGTPTITVDTTGLGGQPITATVEVGGYNLNCTATCTTQVPAPLLSRKFDEYPNVRFNDEKARLDNFAIQLQNEPSAQGYIIAYGGRSGRAGEAQLRANRARDYLVNERGIEAGRIVTIDGGIRDNLTVELWVVPQGATPPSPRR